MTAVELHALPSAPSGVDQWLFAGELVERRNPNEFHTPTHAAVVATLSRLLGNWVNYERPRGFRAYGYGCPFLLGTNPDTLVWFDASIAPVPLPLETDAPWVVGPPVLAVEVIERDEDFAVVDRLVRASLTAGVNAVWVIDPFEELVTVSRPGRRPLRVRGASELPGDPDLPGFRCKVADIFE